MRSSLGAALVEQSPLQPALVELRRRAGWKRRPPGATRGVVPRRRHARKPRVAGSRLRERELDQRAVVVDRSLRRAIGQAQSRRTAPQPRPRRRGAAGQQVGLELDGRVEADLARGRRARRRSSRRGAGTARRRRGGVPPRARCRVSRSRIGQQRRPIDEKQRPPVDPDVALVGEGRGEPRGCGARSSSASVALLDEDLVVAARPRRRVQFSLAQHRQNGKSGRPEASTSSNGRSRRRRALEPVVVVDRSRRCRGCAPARPGASRTSGTRRS